MRANDPDLLERDVLDPTRQWRIRRTVSSAIESGEECSRSWVSATGPESELSIGRTPNCTSPATAASTTAVKLGSGTTRARCGKSCVQAAAAWAPSRPGVGDGDGAVVPNSVAATDMAGAASDGR